MSSQLLKPMVCFGVFVGLGAFLSGALAAQEHPTCRSPSKLAAELEQLVWSADACRPDEACWQERLAQLSALRDQHPEDVHVHREFQNAARTKNAERLRTEYERLWQAHPTDGLYLYLYSRLLRGEELASLVDGAERVDQASPWFHLARSAAQRQAGGGRPAVGLEPLLEFMKRCPNNFDVQLHYAGSVGDSELWLPRLPGLRSQLERSSILAQLRWLGQLWSLDFKLHPPAQYDDVRARVRRDLDRLAASPLASSRAGLALRHQGYELLGDQQALKRVQEAQREAFACDTQVANRTIEAWFADRGGRGAMTAFDQEQWQELDGWARERVRRCPDSFLFWNLRIAAIKYMKGIDASEVNSVLPGFLEMWEKKKETIGTSRTPYADAIELTLRHDLDRSRLDEWMGLQRTYLEGRRTPPDQWPEAMRSRIRAGEILSGLDLDLLATRVEIALGRLDDVPATLAQLGDRVDRLETLPELGSSKAPAYEARLLELRAELAIARDEKAHALTHLRRAMLASEASRQHFEDRARELWRELGGSDETFESPLSPEGERAGEVTKTTPWTEVDKPLGPFELSDLEGRVWTLDDLLGRTVLINVWATWCGPCRVEMPHLADVQEQLASREDVMVVTFNVDRNPGLIEPYLKDEGLDFTVLLAERHVWQLLGGGVAIPQNWIVDAEGTVRLEQFGFATEAADDWLESTMAAIETVADGARN